MNEETITIDTPYFAVLSEVINKHLAIIDVDSPPGPPSVNDEIEILVTLMGLSRIIEYNMRVAFEKFNLHNNLNLSEPATFNDLLISIEPYIVEKNRIKLLDYVRLISNGLVHSDFEKVYLNSKKAYEVDNIDFHYKEFDPPIIMFETTITKNGLSVFVKGDEATATDTKGNKIPLKVLVPDGTNHIDIDFKYYYLTGTFIFTYDVLYTAYKYSVIFKEKMKKEIIQSNK